MRKALAKRVDTWVKSSSRLQVASLVEAMSWKVALVSGENGRFRALCSAPGITHDSHGPHHSRAI
jgi:hypothetical protein